MRGIFAPGCGDIKPDTIVIRRLLFDEGSRRVERRDWEKVRNEDYIEIKTLGGEVSESDASDMDSMGCHLQATQ
jgi:hypothetical protein